MTGNWQCTIYKMATQPSEDQSPAPHIKIITCTNVNMTSRLASTSEQATSHEAHPRHVHAATSVTGLNGHVTSCLSTIHKALQQSCLVLSPPVHPRQVSIQVLHTGEGMFSRGAAWHPTIKWPLPLWILSTHPTVLPHALPYCKHLSTVGAQETFISLRGLCSMFHPEMLPHALPGRKVLVTVTTGDSLPLHTSSHMCPQHLPTWQNLATFFTGEFFSPVHSHMAH